MTKNEIYMDWAATTPMHPGTITAMTGYYNDDYLNPSALYAERSSGTLAHCRRQMAYALGENVHEDEIFFTSGGTEANNIITRLTDVPLLNSWTVLSTPIEHASMIRSIEYARWPSYKIQVDEHGVVDVEHLESLLKKYSDRRSPIFVSVMAVNNELGTMQRLSEIASIVHEYPNTIFFSDWVQFFGHDRWSPPHYGVDMCSISAHKFGGPKGVGALYIKKDMQTYFDPVMLGGHQESGMRAGTENMGGIIGMTYAAQKAAFDSTTNDAQEKMLLKRLREGLSEIPDIWFNSPDNTINILNVGFKCVSGTDLLVTLMGQGIYLSAGSACNSGQNTPSHVLSAIGLSDDDASSCVRFSIGWNTTADDIDYVIKAVKVAVDMLRGA